MSSLITPELIFRQALDGTDQTCMAEIGRLRHTVIQQALRLAQDPSIALEHPELVQRIRDHAETQRMKRSASLLRNEGGV